MGSDSETQQPSGWSTPPWKTYTTLGSPGDSDTEPAQTHIPQLSFTHIQDGASSSTSQGLDQQESVDRDDLNLGLMRTTQHILLIILII